MNAILASWILAAAAQAASPAPPPSLKDVERQISDIVEKARRSVVRVTAVVSEEDPATPVGVLSFAGIVFSPDGYIVTDGSGVERAGSVEVTLENETRKPGRVVGIDRRTSVAILKIEATGLSAAAFGGGADPATGSFAIVIGNPYGLPAGPSIGTLSGTDRAIVVDRRRYEGMFQITTPTFPGDCGGLVADSSGRCLGIVHSRFEAGPRIPTVKELTAPEARGAGATFVTPVASIRFVAERVIKHGHMVRGWAGLTLRPIGDEARAQLKIEAGRGAEIASVETGGPAEAAGLRRRDILLTWGGSPVADIGALQRGVMELERELSVKITYLRQGEPREAEIGLKIESP